MLTVVLRRPDYPHETVSWPAAPRTGDWVAIRGVTYKVDVVVWVVTPEGPRVNVTLKH